MSPAVQDDVNLLSKGYHVNRRFIDWIWHIRGSLALAPGQTNEEAFDRLDGLFHEVGTSRERNADSLVFSKKDSAAQDKMSVFDGGELCIDRNAPAPVLHYNLKSRALLLCFLAPLLFLAFGQLSVTLGSHSKASEQSEEAKGKASKDEDKAPEVAMNPIDKFLGAPEPEKKDADKDKKDKDKSDRRFSPTSAYVFAGIFAVLYVVGRILEDRLVRRLFRRRLEGL